MRASVTGPILTKVWNTPDNGYAERFKHVVEPEFVVQRTTAVRRLRPDRQDRRRRLHLRRHDARDLRRDEPLPGPAAGRRRRRPGAARPRVPQRPGCSSPTTRTRAPAPSTAPTAGGFFGKPPSNFSPIALIVRANPTNAVGASLRLEYNEQAGEFETIQANGTVNAGDWLQTTGGWSQRKYLQIVDPLLRPPNNFLSSRTNVNLGRRARRRRLPLRPQPVGQDPGAAADRLLLQCPVLRRRHRVPGVQLPERRAASSCRKDRRFNISFTLAGVGSFSNILGAFGIGQGATGSPAASATSA